MSDDNTVIIHDKNKTFFDLLKTAISNNVVESFDNNMCLISQQTLDNTKITLSCNHSFNYGALYKEVYNQKYHKPSTEIQSVYKNEIKCPYCRKIQNGLLPYEEGYTRTKWVNDPPRLVMKNNACIYTFKSGKRKGLHCDARCTKEYCNKCLRVVEKRKKKCNLITNHLIKSSKENEIVSGTSIISTHANTTNTQATCSATIKTGTRKGLQCRNTAKYNDKCGKHST